MHEGDKAELVDEDAQQQQQQQQRHSAENSSAGCCGASRAPRGLALIVLTAVVFSAIVTVALVLSIIFGAAQVHPIGSVAADSTEASECGLEMLRMGGSAVDAAVAAAMCSAVTQYHHTGIGGGGLMLVHQHRTDKTTLFDFRESAPASATADMFKGDASSALYTGLGTGVPGFVRGLSQAHRQFGSLSWRQTLQPAIRLAERGFRVGERLRSLVAANARRIGANAKLASVYLDGASAKPTNSVVTRPDLGLALKRLSEKPDDLYTGQLAQEIVSAVAANGGNLTLADLSAYAVRRPGFVVGHFFNFTVRAFPAPASGGPLLLLVANALTKLGQPASLALHYHRMAELLKFAYAEASQLGDTQQSLLRQTRMLSADFAAAVARNVSDARVFSNSTSDYANFLPLSPNGTAQVSVVDNQENYVSMTTSLHGTFGSFITTNSGILLNNQLAAFSISDSQPPENRPGPGKRPVTLMTPAFVFNPRQRCALRFAIGASNNTRVPAAVANVLSELANRQLLACPHVVSRSDNERRACLPVPESLAAARVSAQFDSAGPFVEYESNGLPDAVVQALKAKGQRLVPNPVGIGAAEVVAMDMYSLVGLSDTRRCGAEARSLA